MSAEQNFVLQSGISDQAQQMLTNFWPQSVDTIKNLTSVSIFIVFRIFLRGMVILSYLFRIKHTLKFIIQNKNILVKDSYESVFLKSILKHDVISLTVFNCESCLMMFSYVFKKVGFLK